MYRLQDEDGTIYEVTFLPGYGRWKADILDLIRARGGNLREAADAILAEVTPAGEEPLLAIEYCGALPAGNQAWQRAGRAYSFARARIPYVYVAELGGFELSADRTTKAARYPNPAVPFSYLGDGGKKGVHPIAVFVPSPGAGTATHDIYEPIYGQRELLQLIKACIAGSGTSVVREALNQKTVSLVKLLSANRKRADGLTPEQWEEAYRAIRSGGSLIAYLEDRARIAWRKKVSIPLTATATAAMQLANKYGIGLSSSSLPICVIPAAVKSRFASDLEKIYGTLPDGFRDWLVRARPLTICWVMGFKPRGDDARPDRGLPALARMLVGDACDLMCFVYGPAKQATWPRLLTDAADLARTNGLWEAIMATSDALLVDSSTAAGLSPRAFLKAHWARNHMRKDTTIVVPAIPEKIGENDVDTVLHTVLARIQHKIAFEGMCNPPGGDWSGMSLIHPDEKKELRWLTLPRVSGEDSKRPDHLIQFVKGPEKDLVLLIESKDQAGAVENEIGPRLKRYFEYLLATEPSIERPPGTDDRWARSTTRISAHKFHLATAAAYVYRADRELKSVAARAQVDLVIAAQFSPDGVRCCLHGLALTGIGKQVLALLSTLPRGQYPVTVLVK
ncbi:MAG: hypothetical protein ABSH44_09380 [Bryobacteraceae bacterium]|jgi:hypothetical protein